MSDAKPLGHSGEHSSGRFLTELTVIATLGGLLFGKDTSLEQLEERLEAEGASTLIERTTV